MANITATFIASFDSFYDAVDKAVVELKSFETETENVAKAMTRMGESFSGRKVIQDATMMVEAIEQMGGVTKLTDKELQRMGSTVAEAAAKMTALGMDVPPAFEEVLEATKKVGKGNEETTLSFGKLVGAYVTGEAILGAVTKAWDLLSSVVMQGIASAQESEKAQAKLTAALRAQGTEIPSVQDAFAGYADSLEQTTIYSGDAITAAEAMLVLVGNVMPRDMEKALQATTNLASGLGIDLEQATQMVASAAEGNVGALKKQGVVLDENKVKTQGFTYVLNEINETMAGQAVAAASTYEGRLIQLGNAWDNVLGSIGRLITQNSTLLTAIDLITQGIRGNTGELNNYQTANEVISAGIINTAKAISVLLTALDYLQTAYQYARTFSDKVVQGFISFGVAVLQTSKAISTAQSYIPGYGESATKAANDAGAAIEYLQGAWQGLQLDQDDALASAKSWSAGIGALNTRIGNFSNTLEETRGKTTQLVPAVDNVTNAWQRSTRAVSADADALKRASDAAAYNAKVQREEEAKSWKTRGDMLNFNGVRAMEEAARQYQERQAALAYNLKTQEEQERQSYLTRARAQNDAGVRALQALEENYKRIESHSKAALNNVAIQARRDYDAIIAGGDRFSAATRQHFKEVLEAAEEAASGIRKIDWTDRLAVLERVLGGIQDDFAETAVVGVRAAQELDKVWKDVGTTTGQKVSSTLVTGLNAAASMFGDKLGAKAQGALEGAASGAAIGSIFGGLGTAIGAGIGAIKGLFGNKEKKQVEEARQALIAQAGGFDQLNAAAAAAGVTMTAVLNAKKVKDYELAVKQLQDAIVLQDTATATLAETTQRYGFTIEELGPALARQELDKQAQQLFKDWEVLNAAGIDTIAITARMAEGINGYVNRAIAMGSEVPDAMRPMLESMAQNGQLLDANGNKIESLESAGISFSMTMSQGFQSLITEVSKLTDAIARGLGLAVDQTSNKLRTMPRSIEVGVNYKDPGFARTHDVQVVYHQPTQETPEFQHGTHGKFINFGSETLVALHGREAIVPEGDVMNGTAGLPSGGGAPVIINIDARGAFFDDPGSQQRLADRIEQALNAKHGLTHRRRAA